MRQRLAFYHFSLTSVVYSERADIMSEKEEITMKIVMTFEDEAVELLVVFRRMIGMTTVEDFVLKAIHFYQWVLIQQAFDHTVISMCSDGCLGHVQEQVDTMLPDEVIDKELGREYFGDVFE